MMRYRRAFTVTELLFVISILAIVIGITFGVVERVIQRVPHSVCIDNMHQTAVGISLYTADYDETFPAVRQKHVYKDQLLENFTWTSSIVKYVKKADVIACPDVDYVSPLEQRSKIDFGSGIGFNESLNREVVPGSNEVLAGIKLTQVRSSAVTVMIFDVRAGIIALDGPDTVQDPDLRRAYRDKADLHAIKEERMGGLRHNAGANYAFPDGHTKWLLPTSFSLPDVAEGSNYTFSP